MKVTYQRSQLSSQSDTVKNEIDPAFVNDQYWLLFPQHAIWDSSAKVTDEADGAPLRIFFSDVSVKVAGSDSWMNAQ